MNRTFEKLQLFSGNANPPLAQEIAACLKMPLGKAQIQRFSDGEVWVEIEQNVRGMDVFVIQPTCNPVNEHLMELLVMVDALKRASADRITAVMPYYGYARQDRKVQPRTPITAKLVADLLTAAGVNRVLAIDLHAGQIQGFFNIPFDHLFAAPVLLDYLKEKYTDEMVVVAPDAGGAERARAYAKRLEVSLAMIDKRRSAPNVSEVMNVIGEVEDKTALIVDDIADTAGTLTQAAEAIHQRGAKKVLACITHPVLSGKAVERIEKSVLSEVVVANTIPLTESARKCSKLRPLSVASLLAEAIRRIHTGESVSSLFI